MRTFCCLQRQLVKRKFISGYEYNSAGGIPKEGSVLPLDKKNLQSYITDILRRPLSICRYSLKNQKQCKNSNISQNCYIIYVQVLMSNYILDDRRSIPGRGMDLYVQTGPGAHPASYPMGTGGTSPGGKARPGRDADHLPHLVPKSRMSGSYDSYPPWRLHGGSGAALFYRFTTCVPNEQNVSTFFR
jgi:hypothetical protein